MSVESPGQNPEGETYHEFNLSTSPELAKQIRFEAGNTGQSIASFAVAAAEYSALIDAATRIDSVVEASQDCAPNSKIRLNQQMLSVMYRSESYNTDGVEGTTMRLSDAQMLSLNYLISIDEPEKLTHGESHDDALQASLGRAIRLYISRQHAERAGFDMVLTPGPEAEDFFDIVLGSPMQEVDNG